MTHKDTNEELDKIFKLACDTSDGTISAIEAAHTIEALCQSKCIEAEKRGRSDELLKLYEWGKTIDDQWNAHFKERLNELSTKGQKE